MRQRRKVRERGGPLEGRQIEPLKQANWMVNGFVPSIA